MLSEVLGLCNLMCLTVLVIYALRQYILAFTSLIHKIEDGPKPGVPNHTVSILIPARNEGKVIGRLLDHLAKQDYPHDKIEVLVLNDASEDRTSEIAHDYASRYPFIRVIDRTVGGIGKGDVMNQGIREAKNEIIFVFDADYTPAPDTITRLIRWFSNPRIGLVQGKIHVSNKDENILTKMVHTERVGGFLCDLFSRDILKVSNQYGGTVGGFRKDLIKIVGEWEPRIFSEDTDLTCRTLLAGYKVKYDASVNCGEEAPTRLKVYYRQRYRWIRGQTVCALKYTMKFLKSSHLSLREKIEGSIWINVNCVPLFVTMSLGLWLVHWYHYPICFMLPTIWAFVYLLSTAGGLVSMVLAGLSKIKQLKYAKYVLLMIANAYPMCFIVTWKAYYDILTNKPLKWVKTERSGVVT